MVQIKDICFGKTAPCGYNHATSPGAAYPQPASKDPAK